MELAVDALKGKYISNINVTSLDESDGQSAMLAGLIANFTATKKAVTMWSIQDPFVQLKIYKS